MINKKKIGAPSSGTPENASEMPGAHQLVTRAWVIALIAERVRSKGESIRDVKDKVGQRINYAHKTQKSLAPPVGRKFVFGDVVRWARKKPDWREALTGLPESAPIPVKPKPLTVRASLVVAYAHLSASLDECRALIVKANQDNVDLMQQLQAARNERDRLRPHADKWQELRKKNRTNALKKKGGA